VLALEEDVPLLPAGLHLEVVGSTRDPDAVATRLFGALRALEAAGLDILFTREVADPHSGIGRALADRLQRASRHVLD